MSAYQLLEAHVALGGDILNVVHRHQFNPITFPEMLVLKHLHGANAVTEIYDVGAVERDDEDEMKRLVETYGDEVIRKQLFPGAGVRLPNGDNRFKPRVVSPDRPLAQAVPPPEVRHAPGEIDYEAQARSDMDPAFVPSAVPTPDPTDPFGENNDGSTSSPTDEAAPSNAGTDEAAQVRRPVGRPRNS